MIPSIREGASPWGNAKQHNLPGKVCKFLIKLNIPKTVQTLKSLCKVSTYSRETNALIRELLACQHSKQLYSQPWKTSSSPRSTHRRVDKQAGLSWRMEFYSTELYSTAAGKHDRVGLKDFVQREVKPDQGQYLWHDSIQMTF